MKFDVVLDTLNKKVQDLKDEGSYVSMFNFGVIRNEPKYYMSQACYVALHGCAPFNYLFSNETISAERFCGVKIADDWPKIKKSYITWVMEKSCFAPFYVTDVETALNKGFVVKAANVHPNIVIAAAAILRMSQEKMDNIKWWHYCVNTLELPPEYAMLSMCVLRKKLGTISAPSMIGHTYLDTAYTLTDRSIVALLNGKLAKPNKWQGDFTWSRLNTIWAGDVGVSLGYKYEWWAKKFAPKVPIRTTETRYGSVEIASWPKDIEEQKELFHAHYQSLLKGCKNDKDSLLSGG